MVASWTLCRPRTLGTAAGVLVLVLVLGKSAPAAADQPRDWMFSVQDDGLAVLVDYFGTGAQLSLEHNLSFYGKANTLTTRVSSLVGYPLGEVTANAQLRVLFLAVGGMIGYRAIWRNLSFEPGDDGEYCSRCDRTARRRLDPIFGSGPSTDNFTLAEGYLRLFAPFNDYVVLTSQLVARYEDRRDRSYDWFYTNIHDGGVNTRWETLLFFKHRGWGGFAPYLQLMNLPRAGKYDAEWAFGFNAVTRPGIIRRDDLLFLTFLIRPSDKYYGQHSYYSPVRALLVYRMKFQF